MSEKSPQTAERQQAPEQLPDRDQFIDGLRARRNELSDQINGLEETPGFKFPHGDIEKQRKITTATTELNDLNAEWSAIGGEALEDAEMAEVKLRHKIEEIEMIPGFRYDGGALRQQRDIKQLQEELTAVRGNVEAAKDTLFANAFPQETSESQDPDSLLFDAMMDKYSPAYDEGDQALAEELPDDDQDASKKTVTPEVGPAPAPTAEDYEAAGQTPSSTQMFEKAGQNGNSTEAQDQTKAKSELDLSDDLKRLRAKYLVATADAQKGHWWGTRGMSEGRVMSWLIGKANELSSKMRSEDSKGDNPTGLGDKISDLLENRLSIVNKRADKLSELGKEYAAELDKMMEGFSPEEKKASLINMHSMDMRDILRVQQEAVDKKRIKPLSKWVRRAGYGVAAAVGVGIALTPVGVGAGLLAAGAGAAGVRRWATKNNVGTIAEDEKTGEEYPVAGRVMVDAHKAFADELKDEADVSASRLVEATDELTQQEMKKNRERLTWPVVATLGATATALYLQQAIGYELHNTTTPPATAGEAPTPPTPPTTAALGKALGHMELAVPLGNEFTVEPGNGLTHELAEWAQVNGQELSPEQAGDLHRHLLDKFGPEYFSGDTYSDGADLRIASPGQAHWAEGVAEDAKQWMVDHGAWK